MWIVILLLFIIAVLSRGAYRNYLSMTGQLNDTPKYWNGPIPTPEEHQRNLKTIEDIIRNFPGSGLEASYPEIVGRINKEKQYSHLITTYRELDKKYRAGLISKSDYEAAINDIAQNLDLEDIT